MRGKGLSNRVVCLSVCLSVCLFVRGQKVLKQLNTSSCFLIIISTQLMLTQGMVRGDLLPLVRMRSKGLSNQVVSVHGQKNLKHLKYAVICSEKGTITMFDLFLEGHSTDSTIYLKDTIVCAYLI